LRIAQGNFFENWNLKTVNKIHKSNLLQK